MGLKIVDEGYGRTPELKKDAFWDDEWVPLYSEESAWEKKYTHMEGSLSHIKLDKSVSQIRMVPLQRNDPSDGVLRRRFSSAIERIVPVKNTDTTSRSSIGSFIRSSSKLSFYGDDKMSRKNSLANFLSGFRQTPKETPIRMSACDGSESATASATAGNDSCPRMNIDLSSSGSALNHSDSNIINDPSRSNSSARLSRVMSDESNGGMQMFSIGDHDIRIAMEALGTSAEMADIELAEPEDVQEALSRLPSQNRDTSDTAPNALEKKPNLQFSYST